MLSTTFGILESLYFHTGDDDLFSLRKKSFIFHIEKSFIFTQVTMSTVGYGDYYCKTYIGKIISMAFIGVGLVCVHFFRKIQKIHSYISQTYHQEPFWGISQGGYFRFSTFL